MKPGEFLSFRRASGWIRGGGFLVVVCSAAIALACNIPVFRYALERWKADPCQVLIWHSDDWQGEHDAKYQALLQAIGDGKQLNLKPILIPVSREMDETLRTEWERWSVPARNHLPFVVVRSGLSDGKAITHWHGPLESMSVDQLADSPARQELRRRLLAGDSVVWLFLQSNDPSRNQKARDALKECLDELSQQVTLPEGIGLPGSELFADTPLFVRFSIQEVNALGPEETYLRQLAEGVHGDALEQGQPVLIPVYGRGRALEVLLATSSDAGLIRDLTHFLCGACSCQVKERNPGFDLVLKESWDLRLFGEEPPPPDEPARQLQTESPRLLKIPPGRKAG